MITLSFTAEPEAAQYFLKQVEMWEEEEQEREKQHLADVRRYVNGLSKKELKEQLINALLELEEKNNRYW